MKLSKILSKLEKKGLHKTAENVRKVVGQNQPARVAIEDLFKSLTDGDFSELRSDVEMELEDAELLRTNIGKQFYKADKFFGMAAREFRKLSNMLK